MRGRDNESSRKASYAKRIEQKKLGKEKGRGERGNIPVTSLGHGCFSRNKPKTTPEEPTRGGVTDREVRYRQERQ